MVKSKERVNRAQDRALERLDYVMDYYETPDFVEVTGRMGGDVITYRVFDDGRMYVMLEKYHQVVVRDNATRKEERFQNQRKR